MPFIVVTRILSEKKGRTSQLSLFLDPCNISFHLQMSSSGMTLLLNQGMHWEGIKCDDNDKWNKNQPFITAVSFVGMTRLLVTRQTRRWWTSIKIRRKMCVTVSSKAESMEDDEADTDKKIQETVSYTTQDASLWRRGSVHHRLFYQTFSTLTKTCWRPDTGKRNERSLSIVECCAQEKKKVMFLSSLLASLSLSFCLSPSFSLPEKTWQGKLPSFFLSLFFLCFFENRMRRKGKERERDSGSVWIVLLLVYVFLYFE